MGNKARDMVFQSGFWKSLIREKIPVDQWLASKILGLGLINLSLFVILAATGILLTFYYIPHTERAYDDLQDLRFVVSYGAIIHNTHRWAAYLMIVSVFLHMSRAFFMGEYYAPRQFNWVIGVILFLCTMGLGLTGSYLPWDQKAYWGITIMSNITASVPLLGEKVKYLVLGGTEVGQNALLRLYVIHTKVLPILLVLLMGAHFWRIRKDDHLALSHGAGQGDDPQETQRPSEAPAMTWTDLVTRESSKFLLILAIVMAASILFDARLEEKANPSVTPSPIKAVWFFVGLQEVLSWGAPFWFGIVIPNLAVIALMLVPYLDRRPAIPGEWFHPSRRLQNILFTAFVTIAIGLILIGELLRGPSWVLYWPWESWPAH